MVTMASRRRYKMRVEPDEGSLRNGQLLTVSEAAGLLSAHPNSVRRWADMGLLNTYRVGLRRDRRFRLKEVVSFLTAGLSVK
jgi:excisionase family DNA binding protein